MEKREATHIHQVLIVDDHEVVRDGLALLIGSQPDFAICGQVEDVQAAKQAVESLRPTVVIVDLMIGHGDGLQLLRCLRAEHPGIRTLVFSMHHENTYAERALRAGACGYVMKQQPTREILVALRTVVGGDIYLSPKLATILMRKGLDTKPERERGAISAISRLTDREIHVFQLIGTGLSTREIARALGLSVKTVESYREAIKVKAGFRNAEELVRGAQVWCESRE
jgi:DNA-binding NarL/FixJ family response regulator